MEVGEKAVGAMQVYLRLKRYILPSGIAREALQAAVPFLSQPSAARELALEEAAKIAETWSAYGDYYDDGQKHEIAAAIRALSSPDHIADAGKVEGDGWLPIESAPKDGTVIQAWHQVHKCPVSVLWKDDGFPYRGERLNWHERTYTTAWPERAFTHWRPLPSAPASEGAE